MQGTLWQSESWGLLPVSHYSGSMCSSQNVVEVPLSLPLTFAFFSDFTCVKQLWVYKIEFFKVRPGLILFVIKTQPGGYKRNPAHQPLVWRKGTEGLSYLILVVAVCWLLVYYPGPSGAFSVSAMQALPTWVLLCGGSHFSFWSSLQWGRVSLNDCCLVSHFMETI